MGLRKDIGVLRPEYASSFLYPEALKLKDSVSSTIISRLEFVHDNTIHPADNIWNGLRWKIYTELFVPANAESALKNKNTINVGFDARHYLKIYRNFIWAVRGAGDFSFGDARLIYYLGGEDGWLFPKFNHLPADTRIPYAFQTLALNLRGFNQNAANGSNNLVLNSELRLPVFATLLSSPINNAFLRNFQLVQFFDLGTAWSGPLSDIKRPTIVYHQDIDTNGDGVPDVISPLDVKIKAGGLGPFAGGYGFGARSTLLGYFLKGDIGWQMKGIFRGPAVFYFSLGFDF
jgi:hypothetical protein